MSQQVRHEGQPGELPDEARATLTTAAVALAAANDQVAALEGSRRRMAVSLAGVMRWLPVPVVLVDHRRAVYACSDAARPLGFRPGGVLDPLGPDVARTVEELLTEDPPPPTPVSSGSWCAARADTGPDEPVQVLVWQVPVSDPVAAPP
jgi:hypothetical protein